jgi:hypothetical protein
MIFHIVLPYTQIPFLFRSHIFDVFFSFIPEMIPSGSSPSQKSAHPVGFSPELKLTAGS